MGSGRTISQQAFDEMVHENIDDLGMDPTEALEDAIQTLTLQGVDLAGIVKSVPGTSENPVVRALEELRSPGCELDRKGEVLDELAGLCEETENAAVAARNGGVEVLCSVVEEIWSGPDGPVVSALRALRALLRDVQSTETFRQSSGPKIVVDILDNCTESIRLLDSACAVVAASATSNEVVKELFMDLKIDKFILKTMNGQFGSPIGSLYDVIRVLLTSDDNRVVASQVYGYARQFAKIGIADALVAAINSGSLGSDSLISVCTALRAVAVNDEICRSIFENGGIDAILKSLESSGEQHNKAVAKSCCSVLAQLAGSDQIKNAIVQKGGLGTLIQLASRFSEDPTVLQEIMPIICALSLRSPENAACAIEAGAGDMVIQAMQKFPTASQMQKQSCLMIRNLVVRNQENRTILLGLGIEKLIRQAKSSHRGCKDAATAALRDLGLENYNS